MDKNKILKYLIPVIAVVVLIESVVLISKLGDRQGVQIQPNPVSTSNLDTTTEQVKPEDAIYELVLSADKKDIKLGEKVVVELRMKALSTRSVDAINAYLRYDTAAFEASNLTFDTKLPKPAFEKISTLRSMVVANFLITEPKGLMLDEAEEVTLMKFDVSPKMTGSFDFEISAGDDLKESVTMIVENTTATVLPYVSNKLTINVLK
jgi:hypothetical protein